jgi:hypothetical protein
MRALDSSQGKPAPKQSTEMGKDGTWQQTHLTFGIIPPSSLLSSKMRAPYGEKESKH